MNNKPHSNRATLVALAIVMLLAGRVQAQFIWAGYGDPGATNYWDAGTNWLGGVVPNTSANILFYDGGFATISAPLSSPNIGELDLGAGGSPGEGTILQTAGQLNVESWFNIGANGGGFGSATYDISGGVMVHVTGGNFDVGAGGTGTNILNIHGTGIVTNDSGNVELGEAGNSGYNYMNVLDNGVFIHAATSDFNVGDSSSSGVGCVSVLTISNNATVQSGANFFGIGHSGYAIGTVNLAGGILLHTGGSQLSIGQGSPDSLGTLNVNGGLLRLTGGATILVGDGSSSTGMVEVASGVIDHSTGGGALNIGSTYYGVFNQSGGFVTNTTGNVNISGGGLGMGTWNISGGVAQVNFLHVGNGSANPAMLNVSGTGLLISQQIIEMGAGNGAATNTINLNGGTLSCHGIQADANNKASSLQIINFNGGVLQAGANNVNFLNPITNLVINVLGGGAVFDDGGCVIAVTNNLSGVGGVTKQGGAGMLTLSGVNTYQGATIINSGELISPTAGSAANSAFTVNSGATNGVQVSSANGDWACAGLSYGAGSTYADFNFASFAPSATTAPIQVNGNLSINNSVGIIIRGTQVTSAGQYPLIKYTGTLSGTPPAAPITLPGSVVSATIVNNTGNHSIDLNVTAVNAITFTFSPTNSIGAIVGSNAVVTMSVSPSATASGPYTVTLTSGNTGVTASQTVIVAQGTTSTNLSFPISGVGVSTVTASGTGGTPANLTVMGSLPSIIIAPAAVGATVGSNAVVTLSLTNANNFPFSGPYTVTLTSGNTAVTANQTVTLPAGVYSTNVSFLIVGSGVSTVTATGTGLNPATVQVTGAMPVIVLPRSALGNVGGSATATMTITNQFPFSGSYTVTLTSGNTSVTPNQTVNLPAGVFTTNLSFSILTAGETTVTATSPGLSPATITVGDYNTVFSAGLANQWVGNDYISSDDWTDRVAGVVATLDGNIANDYPPITVPGAFGTNQGVQLYPGVGNFAAGFSIPTTNPPTGYTNYTVTAVIYSPATGPTGGSYYNNQLIIGYDIPGAGQSDWGMSWGGPNNGGDGITAGIGRNGGDTGFATTSALSLVASHAIAMQTSSNNTFSVYVDGALVGQTTGLTLLAPTNTVGNVIPLLSTVGDGDIANAFTNLLAEVRIYTNSVDGAALTAYLTNLYAVWPISLPSTVSTNVGDNALVLMTVPPAATAAGPVTITLTSDNPSVTSGFTVTLPQGVDSTNLSLPIVGTGIAHVTASGTALVSATVTVNGIAAVPLIWTPSVDNIWDINTTANWLLSGSQSTYVDGSTVQFDDTGSEETNVSIATLVMPANVIVSNNAANYSFSGEPIGGGGSLLKEGTGTLTISNEEVYGGSTMISSGAVEIAPPAVVPSGTVAYYTFANPVNLGADSSGNGNTLMTATGDPQYSPDGITGGALYMDGASTLITSGFPTGVPTGGSAYTIAVLERAGTNCPNNGGFVGWGNDSPNECNNLRLNGPNSVDNYWFANDFTVSGLAVNPMDGNWHAIVATWDGTTRTIYVDGVNVGYENPTAPTVVALGFVVGKTTGDVNFQGWIDNLLIVNRALSAGEVAAYSANASLPATTAVKMGSGGALGLNGNNQTIGSLAGPAGAQVNLGSGTLTTGGNNTSTTFGGAISGSGNLVMAGTNVFVLSASNSYSGGTLVSAGTLDVQHDGGLGSGNVTVAAGNLKLELGSANAYIAAHATLTLTDPAAVNLAYVGTDVISNLVINGVQRASGTWGSSSSGAANVDNVHFAGTGVLQVGAVAPPSSPLILPVYKDSTGTNLVIRVMTVNGYNYYLESTTNLTPPVVWITNAMTAGTGGTITNLVPIGSTQQKMFFRYLVP